MEKSIRRGTATSLGGPTTGGEEVYMNEAGRRSDDIRNSLSTLSHSEDGHTQRYNRRV